MIKKIFFLMIVILVCSSYTMEMSPEQVLKQEKNREYTNLLKNLLCSVCKRKFTDFDSLYEHMMNDHRDVCKKARSARKSASKAETKYARRSKNKR